MRRLCSGRNDITSSYKKALNSSCQKNIQWVVSLGGHRERRFRTYERLKRYAEAVKGTLFDIAPLHKAIDEIYRYPLRQTATDTLNRQLRSGASDESLADLVVALRDEGRLCLIHEEEQTQEPMIICSLGLVGANRSMPVNVTRTRELLKNFDFKKLFIEELGWEHHSQQLDVSVDGKQIRLNAIAHKRGIVAFECTCSGRNATTSLSHPSQNRPAGNQIRSRTHYHLCGLRQDLRRFGNG